MLEEEDDTKVLLTILRHGASINILPPFRSHLVAVKWMVKEKLNEVMVVIT